MFKPFSLIFFVLVMVWMGSILITSDPQKRMDRACVPIEYADKGATAVMSLLGREWGEGTHKLFVKTHYGCRYVIWTMFYEEEWNRRAQQAPASLQPPSPARDASAPASQASAAAPAAPRKISSSQ